ncbi:MAG: hypothetical protein CMH83_04940 [Nocardioides sp.]|nr:hypothetical protein [Nocardioides sp.]
MGHVAREPGAPRPSDAELAAARGPQPLAPGLDRSPGHLLWRAHTRSAAALDAVIPEDVDVHAYGVLTLLGLDEPRSQQELATALALSRTSLTRVTAWLRERALVERVRNPRDRRSWALTRTPEGAAAADRWRTDVRRLQAELASHLGPGEPAELSALLLRVAAPDVGPGAPAEIAGMLGFGIAKAHHAVHRRFASALEPLDLEPRHVGALTALTGAPAITQAELARLLGTSAASVVQMVDGLEDRGLVERRRDPVDRRVQRLHVTDAGHARLAELPDVRRSAGEALLGLDDAEAERLTALLVRFVTAP